MALLAVEDVHRTFRRRGHAVAAVDGVTISLERGDSLGLIGESGSGKSTLGRIVLGLVRPDSGDVRFDGTVLNDVSARELRGMRSRLQVVFQEPLESLDPRMSVGQIVGEPLLIHHPDLSADERRERVRAIFEEVGLDPALMSRRPRDLSGGQQQRIGIARAVITHPEVVVLDEPTSSLDLSVRARILALLANLRESLGLTYLFISHDISTVRVFCSRVAVMYAGRIVEEGDMDAVLSRPLHPYTASLLSAELSVDPLESQEYVPLKPGRHPGHAAPDRCPLVGRCPVELPVCATADVSLKDVGSVRRVACVRVHPEPEACPPSVRG
jgi:oligopeptide/dipeptide ABC transporter ATP-binding protein